MTGGIILRGMNNLYFKDTAGFYFEFIPQLIFMTLLFGYMIALIYMKWMTNWDANLEMAPSIISELMGMALKGGSVDGKPVWGSIPVEEMTNKIFVIVSAVSLLSIPLTSYNLIG